MDGDKELVDTQLAVRKAAITILENAQIKEPPYVKMYLTDVCRLYELNKSDMKILSAILRRMPYDNHIVLVNAVKRVLCEEFKMPMNTLNKSIDNLYKAGLLIRKEVSLYYINPMLFGKGEWRHINQIRLNLLYNADGVTATTEIDRAEE